MEWFFDEPAIRKSEVKTFTENWLCPECQSGFMIYTNSYWPTNDPGYHHKCNHCEYTAAIRGKKFPMMTYEDQEI